MSSINLIPVTFRRRLLIRRRLREWSVIWILSVCGAGSVSLAEYGIVLSRRSQLAEIESRCAPLRDKEQATAQMKQELDRLYDRESLLAKLERTDQPAQLIGIIGQATHGERLEVHVGSFELTPVTQTVTHTVVDESGRSKNISVTVEKYQLELSGLGLDDLAVAGFVASLRETGIFESVMLQSSVNAQGMPQDVRRFQVVCVYQ